MEFLEDNPTAVSRKEAGRFERFYDNSKFEDDPALHARIHALAQYNADLVGAAHPAAPKQTSTADS